MWYQESICHLRVNIKMLWRFRSHRSDGSAFNLIGGNITRMYARSSSHLLHMSYNQDHNPMGIPCPCNCCLRWQTDVASDTLVCQASPVSSLSTWVSSLSKSFTNHFTSFIQQLQMERLTSTSCMTGILVERIQCKLRHEVYTFKQIIHTCTSWSLL